MKRILSALLCLLCLSVTAGAESTPPQLMLPLVFEDAIAIADNRTDTGYLMEDAADYAMVIIDRYTSLSDTELSDEAAVREAVAAMEGAIELKSFTAAPDPDASEAIGTTVYRADWDTGVEPDARANRALVWRSQGYTCIIRVAVPADQKEGYAEKLDAFFAAVR